MRIVAIAPIRLINMNVIVNTSFSLNGSTKKAIKKSPRRAISLSIVSPSIKEIGWQKGDAGSHASPTNCSEAWFFSY